MVNKVSENTVTGYYGVPSGEVVVYTTLDKELAKAHAQEILEIWSLIPKTDKHTTKDLLQEKKGDRVMYAKWEHSLIAFDQDTDKVVGFLIGYERKGEDNDQYPENTLYLNTLSVSKKYQGQGIGSLLVDEFIGVSKDDFTFSEFSGPITSVTVQTNSAEWNTPVINFYRKHGFKIKTHKDYPNRRDVVMRYYPPQNEN